MNKDETLYIYEDLLRKNIEKINYYLNQENANLDKECEIMSESLNYYKSDKNTAKIET